MDDWRIHQQKSNMNGIGPIHSYHAMPSRPSPYQINQIKQMHPYQQASSTFAVKSDPNSDVYTLPYTSTNNIEQITRHPQYPTQQQQQQQQQQPRVINVKSTPGPIPTHNAGQQKLTTARTRAMPYPTPSMYAHSSTPNYQCNSHVNYGSQHQMFHPNYHPAQSVTYAQNTNTMKYETMKTQTKSKIDESYHSSTSHYSSICSNSYAPAQQLPPQTLSISQEYQTFSSHSQIFPSPPSNPSTPYQCEFTTSADFGVPYHQSQPSSVNSLTDALCPSGDTVDRQMTPGPPSVGTPRVAQHQYTFPQTPLTPTTTTRSTNEQNSIDELTAFLQDPINTYLTEDITSTLLDDIETLADTYLGGGGNSQQSNNDIDFDYDIILNYLCSDDPISTISKN